MPAAHRRRCILPSSRRSHVQAVTHGKLEVRIFPVLTGSTRFAHNPHRLAPHTVVTQFLTHVHVTSRERIMPVHTIRTILHHKALPVLAIRHILDVHKQRPSVTHLFIIHQGEATVTEHEPVPVLVRPYPIRSIIHRLRSRPCLPVEVYNGVRSVWSLGRTEPTADNQRIPRRHLQQPVTVTLLRLAVRAALVHTQPQAPVMRHSVIIRILRTAHPVSSVIGRLYGCPVRLHLFQRTRHVDVVHIHRISRHIHSVHAHVRQVTPLHCKVGRTYLPRILVLNQSGIGSGRVHRSLSVRVRERAIAHKVHRLPRMIFQFPSVTHRPHLVVELPVILSRDTRYREVSREESRKKEVTPAVVIVLGSVLAGHLAMKDTHTDVTHSHRTIFSLFQLQEDGTRVSHRPVSMIVRYYPFHDARTRSIPLVPQHYLHTVKTQFRHFKESADDKALHLTVRPFVKVTATARKDARYECLTYLHTLLGSQLVAHVQLIRSPVILYLGQVPVVNSLDSILYLTYHPCAAHDVLIRSLILGLQCQKPTYQHVGNTDARKEVYHTLSRIILHLADKLFGYLQHQLSLHGIHIRTAARNEYIVPRRHPFTRLLPAHHRRYNFNPFQAHKSNIINQTSNSILLHLQCQSVLFIVPLSARQTESLARLRPLRQHR